MLYITLESYNFLLRKKKTEMISNIAKKKVFPPFLRNKSSCCTKSRDTPFHGKNTKQNRDLETTTIIRN